MTQCPLPPFGWVCSREPGHAGPCAARREFPYDEYADKAVFRTGLPWTANVGYIGAEEVFSEAVAVITQQDFRAAVTEAWMAGLEYGLELIKTKKETA